MPMLLLPLLLALAGQPAPRAAVQSMKFDAPGVGTLLYGLSVPSRYDPARPRPLVVALHPGGGRTPYYGRDFLAQIVRPGLSSLDAIMIAPDCPARTWADPVAEKAVLALVQHTLEQYAVDRRRVLVVGFSMGGRGAWFMSSRHPELFTAAIPMAASTGDEPIARLATMPTYIIHSRDDEVVPFPPAERNARELEKMGRPVELEVVEGAGHFQMGTYIDSLERAGDWIARRWK